MTRSVALVSSILLLCGLLVVPAAAAQIADPDQCAADTTAPAEVETALDGLLADFIDPQSKTAEEYGYAPGAVFLIETPEWRYHKAIGIADIATGEPINCAMPFQIGSNTKMMTATLLLQLHEEGLLNIDDPLSKYLPQYANALPFGDQMTLRQLATHTSGVFSYTDNAANGVPGIMEGAIGNTDMLTRGYTPDELIQFVIENGEPSFEPGAEGRWAYSNTGYILLGIIIEQITGQTLAEVLEQRIFEPLSMEDTFLWNGVPQPDFGLPSSYYQAPFDLETTDWNMSQGWAAGAVISTAEDMTSFIRALLEGNLFQYEATLGIMQDGVPTGTLQFLQYGIGLGEKQTGLWGHGGQTLGFESDIAYLPADDLSIVIWTNAAKDMAALGATYAEQALLRAGIIEDPAVVAAKAALVSTEWQWQELRTFGEAGSTTPVPDPNKYSLAFKDDGSFSFQADCNEGGGSYTVTGFELSLTIGPMTLATCPPESLSDQYLQRLGAISGFEIDGRDLWLVGTLDGVLYQLRFSP